LRIQNAISEDIVAIKGSSCSYIDNRYYKEKMNEILDEEDNNDLDGRIVNENLRTYPVQISALKIDWILWSKEGFLFLRKLLDSEGMEIFECKAVIIIIEYYYQFMKRRISIIMLPQFFLQVLFLFVSIFLNEKNVDEILKTSNDHKHKVGRSLSLPVLVFAGLNLLSSLWTLGFVTLRVFIVGLSQLFTFQAAFDILFFLLNTSLSLSIIFVDF